MRATFGNRPEDIESAINEKTVAIADTQSFLCVQRGIVPLEDLIKIAKKHEKICANSYKKT